MDSIINLKDVKALAVIQVAKMIGTADSFRIFQDQHGDWHRLNKKDFTEEVWQQIKVGRSLGISIKKSIEGISLLPESEKTTEGASAAMGGEGDYLLSCANCNMQLAVSEHKLHPTELSKLAKELVEKHTGQRCKGIVLKVIRLSADEGVDNPELARLLGNAIKQLSQ